MGGDPFQVAMLAQEVSLDFDQEVVVRLVRLHEWGPAVAVGLPLLILPFDASQTNCSGGFTDLL